MSRLLSDMDFAYKRMRANPVAFTNELAGATNKAERGAHRYKQRAIAMCVGIAREIRDDFALFEKLRDAPCLQNNARIQAATKDNFKKFVAFAVASRSFDGTEASANRISVYSYVMGYFVKKDISVLDIPNQIEAMGGLEGVYDKVKEKKREARKLRDGGESAISCNTENRKSKPGKCEPTEPKAAKAPCERVSLEWILENCLLVMMPKKELAQYLDGSARRGQRRRLDAVYGGIDTNKLHVWEYVYGRDVNADLSSEEDNDNDVDYEDEDAA